MSTRIFTSMPYPLDYYDFMPGDAIFSGDGGFWLDFGDWDAMYTDTAMTVKVTAAGQKVAAVRDKGKNGFHFINGDGARRPTAVIQGGFKCLDFNSANNEYLQSVRNGMALQTFRNMILAETDNVTTFHRFLSVSDGNVDTVGANGLAFNSGSATDIFDMRGLQSGGTPSLQVRANGSGVTPFGVYETLVTLPLSQKAVLYVNNVQVNTDATITGMLTTPSAGAPIIGVMSQNNAPTTTGPLDGRMWQVLHLGTLPSAPDKAKIDAWFNKWRY